MCETVRVEGMNVIICGGQPDHECNEDGIVYGTSEGERFYFDSDTEAKEWYNDNYKRITMGSVACSICEDAMIDNAWKQHEG